LESAGTVAGRFLGAGTVAARLLHAPPPLAARESTRRNENNQATRGSVTASSPLPFLAGGESNVTCKATKSQQQCFSFPSFFQSVPRLLSFPDLSPSSLVSDLFLLLLFHLLICFRWPAVCGLSAVAAALMVFTPVGGGGG
jgi:hypothetical protein